MYSGSSACALFRGLAHYCIIVIQANWYSRAFFLLLEVIFWGFSLTKGCPWLAQWMWNKIVLLFSLEVVTANPDEAKALVSLAHCMYFATNRNSLAFLSSFENPRDLDSAHKSSGNKPTDLSSKCMPRFWVKKFKQKRFGAIWVKILSFLFTNFKTLSLYDIIISEIYTMFFKACLRFSSCSG